MKPLSEQALRLTRLEERRVLIALEGDRTSAYGGVWIFDGTATAKEVANELPHR